MFSWTKHFNKKERLLLLPILVAGLLLRIVNASATQLWRDEVYIFFTSRENNFINLLLQNHWDTAHPPLYFLFLHFWQKISINPFFLRLPSLIISVLILYLIPVLAKKIAPKPNWFPHLALFFYSFSHTQISLNMVARPYPFVIAFMLISMIIFLDLFEDTSNYDRPNQIVLFSVINFFVFFSDYSGVWLLLSYGIYWFVYFFLFKKSDKRHRNLIFKGLLLSLMLCMLWAPFLLIKLNQSLSLETHLITIYKNRGFFYPLISNQSFFTGVMGNQKANLFLSNLILFFSLFGLYKLIRNTYKKGAFLLIVCIVPIFLNYLFSYILGPIFVGRNLLIVNIGIIFSLAYFLSISKKIILVTVIFIIFYLSFFFSHYPYLHFTDPSYNWKKIAEIIYQNRKDTLIYTRSENFMFPPLNYYLLLLKFDKKIQITNNIYISKNTVYFIEFNYFDEPKTDYFYQNLSQKLGCQVKKVKIPYVFFASCIWSVF